MTQFPFSPFSQIDWLRARAHATPHALALILGDDRWDYQTLDQLTDRVSHFLAGQPLPANRRLGILMPNGLGYLCLVHAAARVGVTLVTFNARLTDEELQWQIDFTKCGLVITDQPERYAALKRTERLTFESGLLDVDHLDQVPAYDAGRNDGNIDAHHAIVFTSGTTGRPKAVPITYKQHFYSAMGSAYRLEVHKDDLWLSCLPLYHVGGLAIIFRSTLYGTAIDLHPRFDLDEINRSLDHKPITLISVVPTMLYRLIQTRTGWPASMRNILVGGAAATKEIVKAANQMAGKAVVSTSYGLTETASQFSTQTPAETEQKPGCVGRPFLFNQIVILLDDGSQADIGQIGELWINGPSLMTGYLDNPEANQEKFNNHFFRTGDLGYADADGDIWVVQRRKDLIISGGENIYPSEIERALRSHPAIKEACVVGIADSEWGQVVAAMIEQRPGERPSKEDIIQHARGQLAGYKLPRRIKIVDALPQTASGKIERRKVEALMGTE